MSAAKTGFGFLTLLLLLGCGNADPAATIPPPLELKSAGTNSFFGPLSPEDEKAHLKTLTKEERDSVPRIKKALAERGIWIGPDDLIFAGHFSKGAPLLMMDLVKAAQRTDLPADQLAERMELSNDEKLDMALQYDAAGIARLTELADKVSKKQATAEELDEAKTHTVLRHIVKTASAN